MPWNLEHDSPYCEGFFVMCAIIQVYYFSLQVWHIIWRHAKVSRCLDHFWIFYARFKLYSKRRAWRSFARGGVSLNFHWISDEIACCEPNKYFYKKCWALYHVPVVQIWPASYRFGRNLSFSRGVDGKVPDTQVGKLSILGGLLFFKNLLVPMWNFNFVVPSQNTPFSAPRKWKMDFSCDEKENFLLQHCKTSQDTHVCTIWIHYHKLCGDSISNIGRLP
jgi:hypothetical protein